MVLEAARNGTFHQVERQAVKIAYIRHQYVGLRGHMRIVERAQHCRRGGVHQHGFEASGKRIGHRAQAGHGCGHGVAGEA